VTRAPKLELLWWEGCPSTDRALAELRAATAELGLDDVEITMREIRTDDDAAQEGFTGSPTILIDGIDLVTQAGGGDVASEPSGLTCRIYHRRDGRVAPTPDPDDLRAALREAAARQEAKP
jgi:hypothetical protein